jgi:UDPglucose--hexose-1-phosphate uridylyltransferase
MPTDRRSSFGSLTEGDVPILAGLLREVLARLRSAAADPDFNLVVYSAPAETPQGALFRWHLKILPRITLPAGFELGSGISINTMMPEDAAERLRTPPRG